VSRGSFCIGLRSKRTQRLVGELGAGLKVANEESEGIVDPDSVDRVVSDADKVKMYETYVRPFLPDLGPRSIKTAVCLYTNAPSARFVIDTHPEHERVIFASPCSGHGFKHSAAIGEHLRTGCETVRQKLISHRLISAISASENDS
jgi:glycine/D-amino acid oxidase-like deaminating enzyme